MQTYRLYVKIVGDWTIIAQISASSHVEALHKAIAELKSEHRDIPIKLEQFDKINSD